MLAMQLTKLVEICNFSWRIEFHEFRVNIFDMRTSGTLEISKIIEKLLFFSFGNYIKQRPNPVIIASKDPKSQEMCSAGVFKQNKSWEIFSIKSIFSNIFAHFHAPYGSSHQNS